jgi:methionine aminotransferase
MLSKLPNIGTTIFTTMSKMATEFNAINLSQGFPNFPVDERLVQLLQETSNENTHQYAPMPGHPLLLNEIGNLTEKSYGRIVNPATEILVTAGATQAIFTIIQALVHTGEEVVILDPSYDCYAPAVQLAGGKPVHISLQENFLPDWNKVASAINKSTKLLTI